MKKIKLKSLLKESTSSDEYGKTKEQIRRILRKYNVDPVDLNNIFHLLEKHLK